MTAMIAFITASLFVTSFSSEVLGILISDILIHTRTTVPITRRIISQGTPSMKPRDIPVVRWSSKSSRDWRGLATTTARSMASSAARRVARSLDTRERMAFQWMDESIHPCWREWDWPDLRLPHPLSDRLYLLGTFKPFEHVH